jgi:hypothetical protein
MAVRQTFVTVATLGSSARIAWIDGTLEVPWFEIEDDEGRYAVVCIDGREASRTRHRLFEGARHPDKLEAVLLELGSEEEGIIVPLFSRWLDNSDRMGPVSIPAGAKEHFIQLLLRLGQP